MFNADTAGHEFALRVPILATALFTIVWGDATLRSQIANLKDTSAATKTRMLTRMFLRSHTAY